MKSPRAGHPSKQGYRQGASPRSWHNDKGSDGAAILAPVALRNLQLERDRALRSLTALEVRGRKFFEGSKKFTRNREQRAELEEKIAEIDQKIAKVAGRLKEHA